MKIKIAAVQFESVNCAPDMNLEKMSQFASIASKNQTDFIVFPEMALTGYELTKAIEHKQKLNDPYFETLSAIAYRNNINVIVGLPTNMNGNLYNTICFFNSDGKLSGYYNKMHLFAAGKFKECDYFTPGDTPYLFDSKFGKFGIVICYDIRFPELARSMAIGGAKFIFACGAFPKPRGEMWLSLIKSNAIISQTFVIGVNRVGRDGDFEFAGNSAIVNPMGDCEIIADHDKEDIFYNTIDLDMVDKVREKIPAWSNLKESYTAKVFGDINETGF